MPRKQKPRTRGYTHLHNHGPLTVRQMKFVECYALTGKQRESAMKAGYAAKSAATTASVLLKNDKVLTVLERLQRQVEIRTGIKKDAVVKEMAKIGFSNITDFAEVSEKGALIIKDFAKMPPHLTAAIQEVSQTKYGLRIRLHSKVQALRLIGEHLGLFINRIEVGAPGAFTDLTDAELARECRKLAGIEAEAIDGVVVGDEETPSD